MPSVYSMLMETEGYSDFCESSNESVTLYEKDSSGDYTFDEDTQQFTAVTPGTGTYSARTAVDTPVYTTGSTYESFMETVDMVHAREEVLDKAIRLTLQSTPSRARLKLSYASNGNYDFIASERVLAQGQERETGSFANSTIRYRGSKQAVINETAIKQKVSNSIKFKIAVDEGVEDDVNIVSLTVLSSGLIFEGDADA